VPVFLRGYSGGKFFKLVSGLRVRLDKFLNFRVSVQDGGMVSSTEVSTDFLEAVFSEVSSEVHTDLSGQGDALAPFFTLEVRQADVEVICDGVNNLSDCYILPCEQVIGPERLFGQFNAYFGIAGLCGRVDDCQCTFEFSDVGIYFLRDISCDFFGDAQASEVCLFLYDCDSCFIAWGIDSCDKPPFESAYESFLE